MNIYLELTMCEESIISMEGEQSYGFCLLPHLGVEDDR
jgi:hypothetical protein